MSDSFSRDWFPSDAEPDPVRAAQAGTKPTLPKRFYERAAYEEHSGEFHLTLDGRVARTPARRPLAVPHRALADALAQEWDRQGDVVDPSTMPITRLVNSAIDGVSLCRREVIDDLVRYAGSDLVFYRGSYPARLVEAQNNAWSPILDWARDAHGARFVLSEGVMHVSQPEQAVAAIRSALEEVRSPFALTALHVMTTLTGSVLIALAHVSGILSADEAWDAAHVDELFQESVWGQDHEAMVRRQRREADFKAASDVFRMASQ